MSRRTYAPQLITGRPRDALSVVLDALDAILEDGIAPPNWTRSDSSMRAHALELAFAEAESVVRRLRDSGVVPTPISWGDADELVAAAACICVWGRLPGEPHSALDHLAGALADVPGSAYPLLQLA